MATLRKRKGKWTVEIRRKGHRSVYGTFVHKSDARSFVHKVESEITQNKYKDISEAATTTFKVALHRYIREKIENKTEMSNNSISIDTKSDVKKINKILSNI